MCLPIAISVLLWFYSSYKFFFTIDSQDYMDDNNHTSVRWLPVFNIPPHFSALNRNFGGGVGVFHQRRLRKRAKEPK